MARTTTVHWDHKSNYGRVLDQLVREDLLGHAKPYEDKVRLTSYMLRDSATRWFKNELCLKEEDAFKT